MRGATDTADHGMESTTLTTSTERGNIEVLRRLVHGRCSDTERALIERAYAYAVDAHAGKLRYSGEPYIVHPLGVAQHLAEMGLSATIIAAGLLHDVIEDAGKTPEELREHFGPDVASLVENVTKVGKVRLRGEQRYIENLRKMCMAMAQDFRAVIIKFADRLHNLETLECVPEPKRTRIARESLEIHAPIANRLNMNEIKVQFEDLAFPYVYPEEARWIDSLVVETYDAKGRLRDRIQRETAAELQRHRITTHAIEGRLKPRYSLYQKLIRHERDITQIYDLIALRVIVGDIADCYAVLGILHKRWKPLKGRIKDYIANPKSNGYQSLHTTVAVEDDEVIEFQIRTMAMHEEAQWGAAAAWRYHERSPTKPTARQLRWMEEFMRWQRGITDPQEFLEGMRLEVLRDRILVFTPKGDVIELPEGATPLDLAYAIHTEIGNHATGARVNGTSSLHPLDQPLRNGDMVEILVDPKRKGPSADWLSSVRTTNARSKIRDALRGTLKTKVASWVSATMPKRK